MRCAEPGWIELSRPDRRRGIWMRTTSTTLELCAGREGDDDYVLIPTSKPLSNEDLNNLTGVILAFQFACESA